MMIDYMIDESKSISLLSWFTFRARKSEIVWIVSRLEFATFIYLHLHAQFSLGMQSQAQPNSGRVGAVWFGNQEDVH